MLFNNFVSWLSKNKILLTSFFIFLIPFSITRLPFFLYYPVVTFDPDDGGYFMIVDQLDKGIWPHFSIRTPGYPFFMKLVFLFCKKNFAVIAAQHVMSLISCLFLIYVFFAVFKKNKLLPLFGSVALGIFVSTSIQVHADSTLMSDSLFSNFLILFFAFLIWGMHKKNNLLLAFSSIVMAWAILIRPAGIFLIFVFFLVLFFFFVNSYKKSQILSFGIPFVAILLGLMFYNLLTIQSFSISSFSEHALISYTSTFLGKKDSYGPVANEAIESCQKLLSPDERNIIRNSWDYKKIHWVFSRYYEFNRVRIARIFLAHEEKDTYDLYLKWRPLWRKMALDAIVKHPVIAFKYFYANGAIYFYTRIWFDVDFYQSLGTAYRQSFALREMFSDFGVKDSSFSRRFNKKEYAMSLSEDFVFSLLKEYYTPQNWKYFKLMNSGKEQKVELIPTFLQKVHQTYWKLTYPLFRNNFWSLVYLIAMIFGFYGLLKSRFRHFGTFVFFTMTFSALIYGLFVCISAFPYLRYSYSMEFVYYLAPFLWPICLKDGVR